MRISNKKFTLKNGLTAILCPMSSVESVVVYVAVGAGPRYETEETAGLAHFLEHMLFEGTKKFTNSKDLAKYIERAGGRSGAWTDKEYVSYNVKVPKQHLELAFSYLSDIFFGSLLEKSAIEKEKRIVMEELSRSRDNPEVDIWDLWFEWVWGKEQPLGRSTLGDKVTIGKITKQKLQGYLDKFYCPSNMAIAVVGNFSYSKAEMWISKYFGSGKAPKTPTFKKARFQGKNVHTRIVWADIKQAQLILGFFTDVSYHHKDRFSLRLVEDVLSGGVSSRLFHKLIYELGIAYFAGAQMSHYNDMGLFCISGGFAPENLETAIKAILFELDKLKRQKITQEELSEAKEKAKAKLHFSLETPDSIAWLYSSQQITEKRILTPDEIIEKINEVRAEDIQRVASKYFTTQNLRLTIKGPLKQNDFKRIEVLFK